MQILGAEKALFRALKTKHETPKYGLIYHASLIGQAAPKNKGKMSRVLAAKCALSIRVDAMGDSPEPTIGLESRQMVRPPTASVVVTHGGVKGCARVLVPPAVPDLGRANSCTLCLSDGVAH